MKKTNWKIIVVPHSHWDKEWYFTKQDSDILLSLNIDNIINTFKNNSKYKEYIYDGQSSIIDDYLEFFPHKENELKKIIKQNKLIIGPWYTQPDFFNTTSESLVRNLIEGINVAKKYNSKWMNVAYVPDSFGHNNQMPQIYNDFNFDGFIYWRGINNNQLKTAGTYHDWVGIDGSKIRSYNFLLGYWCAASVFPYFKLTQDNIIEQANNFYQNITPIIEELKLNTYNSQNTILLPLGGDQSPIIELTPQLIEEVNKISNDEWKIGSYNDFFIEVNKKNPVVETISGELKSPVKSRIHKTIASQRYDIKKLIKDSEYLLFNNLEPLAVYWNLNGGTYPIEIIKKSLKLLLTSQAHDSLGGCNSDETNSDIFNRVSRAKNLIESETNKIIKQMSKNIDKKDSFILFNPKLINCNISKKIKLFTKWKNFEIKNNNKKIIYSKIKQIYHDSGTKVRASSKGEEVIKLNGFYETDIYINFGNIKPFSINEYFVSECDLIEEKILNIDYIENENYLIKINQNGILDITNKNNNSILKNQMEIYCNYDFGDSYDYSPDSEPIKKISKLIKSNYKIYDILNGKKLLIENKYEIPLDDDQTKTLEQTFKIEMILLNESKVIDIDINTINVSSKKRWRIMFSTDLINNTSFANQAFCEVERDVCLKDDIDNWEKEKWQEKPVAIETNESYVYLKSKMGKFGILTKGTNEYEILNNNQIHLTLYRTVPILGQNDISWRPGRASGTSEFIIKTNDSKFMNKELNFNIGLFDLPKEENIWLISENYNTDPIYYQNQNFNCLYKRFDRFLFKLEEINLGKKLGKSLLKANCKNIVIKSIKKSEDNQGIIIRCFNPMKITDKISFSKDWKKIKFECVNMLEEKKDNFIFEQKIESMKIKTFYIRIEDINE